MPWLRRHRSVYYLILLAGLLAIIFASYRSFSAAKAPQKPLSELLTALDQKQVVHGTFNSGDDRVDWTDDRAREYRTFYPTGYEATLVNKFYESQASFEATQPAASNVLLGVLLPNIVLFLVIGGFLWYTLRRYGGKQPRAM
jgi:ATP-dependent Zn protease